MTFLSCPEIAEAVVHGDVDGVSIANVLHFQQPGGYNQSSLDALAAAVAARVISDYKPIINDSVNFDSVTCKGLEFINDITSSDNSIAGPGSDASASLPANVSPCVTLRTNLTGRSARGRFYSFPIGTAALSAMNTVSTTWETDIVGFLTGLLGDAAGIGWTFVVLSKQTGGSPRLLGVGFEITDIVMRNRTTDSQRGRLPQGH